MNNTNYLEKYLIKKICWSKKQLKIFGCIKDENFKRIIMPDGIIDNDILIEGKITSSNN